MQELIWTKNPLVFQDLQETDKGFLIRNTDKKLFTRCFKEVSTGISIKSNKPMALFFSTCNPDLKLDCDFRVLYNNQSFDLNFNLRTDCSCKWLELNKDEPLIWMLCIPLGLVTHKQVNNKTFENNYG